MQRRSAAVVALVGLSVLFGVVGAVLWSSQSNTVFWLGNLSSTYLLIAFVGGWLGHRMRASVVVAAVGGLVATVIALLSFYAWAVGSDRLSIGTAAMVIKKYLAGGMITGPIMGLLGGLYARSRSWLWILPLAAAFVLEPLAWAVHGTGRSMPATIPMIEIGLAAGLIALAWRHKRRSQVGTPTS